jgi:hypothetical protein
MPQSVFYLAFFFIVVGIPVLAGMYKRHLAYKERQLEYMSNEAAALAARNAAHTERLEQRMRVLERIATDKGVDLAHSIEQLRDPQPTDSAS